MEPNIIDKMVRVVRVHYMDHSVSSTNQFCIKVDRDKLKISIVQPRWGGFGYGDRRTNFEKFVDDLFEKYGYNKESVDLQFV